MEWNGSIIEYAGTLLAVEGNREGSIPCFIEEATVVEDGVPFYTVRSVKVPDLNKFHFLETDVFNSYSLVHCDGENFAELEEGFSTLEEADRAFQEHEGSNNVASVQITNEVFRHNASRMTVILSTTTIIELVYGADQELSD